MIPRSDLLYPASRAAEPSVNDPSAAASRAFAPLTSSKLNGMENKVGPN